VKPKLKHRIRAYVSKLRDEASKVDNDPGTTGAALATERRLIASDLEKLLDEHEGKR
jgi:hypothetical protein